MISSAVAEARADRGPRPGRVLHVITRLDRGGSTTNTLVCCAGLAGRGWPISLAYGATLDPPPLLAEVLQGGRVDGIEIPSLVRPVRPLSDMRAYRALRRILRLGDFALIHTHSSKAGLLGRRAAFGLPCKVVHTPHGHVFNGYFGTPVTRLFEILERRAARWCDRIIVLTDQGRVDHLERGIGRREQFVTIPSGVPVGLFRAGLPARAAGRAVFGLPADAYVIGSLGRLVPIKGHAVLLEAVARLAEGMPSARVLLVGDGELRAALEAQAAAGPLRGRVVFTGALTDPRPALAAMDLFVMPSLNEGQGRAVVEAMATGLPVIASAVGGLPEVLDGGAAGVLVPPGDPGALAGAIQELAGAADRTSRMIRAGRRRAEQYDERTMIDRIDALYRGLLATQEPVS